MNKVTRTTTFVYDTTEDGIGIVISPNAVVARKSTSAQLFSVYADFFRGTDRIKYKDATDGNLTISTLTGLTTGMSYQLHTTDNRACFKIVLAANATADTTLTFTATLDGKTFDCAIPFKVIVDGAAGKPGTDGKPPMPPMLWEDYPRGYAFQDGSKCADGSESEWIDTCIMPDGKNPDQLVAYYCIKSHVKADDKKPTDGTDNAYWKVFAHQYTSVATNLLLARQAYIKNLMAGAIIMYDKEGKKIVCRIADGDVECNSGTFKNVSVEGTVISGDKEGKHIMLSPGDKSVIVFDESGNECARLDGTSYNSLSDILPKELTFQTFDPSSLTAESPGNVTAYKSADLAKTTAVSANSAKIRVEFSATLTLTKNGTDRAVSQPDDTPFSQAPNAAIEICVTTVNAAGVTVGNGSYWLGGLSPAIGSPSSVSSTINRTVTFSVPPGKHTVSLRLQAGNCTATLTSIRSTVTSVVNSFLARYFANGLALTQSTADYLMAAYVGGRMQLMLGGNFVYNNVRQGCVMFAGKVDEKGTSASLTTLSKPSSLAAPTLSRKTTVGDYELKLTGYGLTTANCLVNVTGYGKTWDNGSVSASAPCKATVMGLTESGGVLTVQIRVSDDASPNYGSFYIEVKRY